MADTCTAHNVNPLIPAGGEVTFVPPPPPLIPHLLPPHEETLVVENHGCIRGPSPEELWTPTLPAGVDRGPGRGCLRGRRGGATADAMRCDAVVWEARDGGEGERGRGGIIDSGGSAAIFPWIPTVSHSPPAQIAVPASFAPRHYILPRLPNPTAPPAVPPMAPPTRTTTTTHLH